MIPRVLAVLLSAALAVAAAWVILTNAYPDEGPWLPISPSHGIHVGDVVIVLAWAVVTALLLRASRTAPAR